MSVHFRLFGRDLHYPFDNFDLPERRWQDMWDGMTEAQRWRYRFEALVAASLFAIAIALAVLLALL